MNTSFGKHVRQLREGKKLSLRNLAKRAAISPAFLVDIEYDRRIPSEQPLSRLASQLGVSTEELIDHHPRQFELLIKKNPAVRQVLEALVLEMRRDKISIGDVKSLIERKTKSR